MGHRMKKGSDYTLVHIRLSEKQMQNLKKLSEKLQCSYSYVINILLSDYVISSLFGGEDKIEPYSVFKDFHQKDSPEKSEKPNYNTDASKVTITW